MVFRVEAVCLPGDAHGGTADGGGALLGPGCVSEVDDVAVAGYRSAGNCYGVIDVDGVPLGGSGGDLCVLQWRRRIDAHPLSNDGLGPWGEAKEAPVGAPWVMYAYIRSKRYPVLGWNFWYVMVCRRSLSFLSPRRVAHLCCRGRIGAS